MLGIILGGGAGSRLYPLTKKRAKPAVPLGANYRLIDIPVSNCINSNVNKIYCLTQFNSASLNRHLSQAYVRPAVRRLTLQLVQVRQWLQFAPSLSACARLRNAASTGDVSALWWSLLLQQQPAEERQALLLVQQAGRSGLLCPAADSEPSHALQNANVGSYQARCFVQVLAASQRIFSKKHLQVAVVAAD